MQKKKRTGALCLLLILAALLGVIVYMRTRPGAENPAEPAAAPEESFPVYSPGSALMRTEEGQFENEGCFFCEDRETGLYSYRGTVSGSGARLLAAGNKLFVIDGTEAACIDIRTGARTATQALKKGAAYGENLFAGTLKDGSLWLAETGEALSLSLFGQDGECLLDYTREASGGARWAAVSPDGTKLAAGFTGKIQVFDLARGKMSEKKCSAEELKNVRFGEDGLLYGDYAQGGGIAALNPESAEIHAREGLEKAALLNAEYAAAQADYDGTLALRRVDAPEGTLYLPGEGLALDRAGFAAGAGMLLCADDMGRYAGTVRRLYETGSGRLLQWAYDGTEDPGSAVLSDGFGWGAYVSDGSLFLFSTDEAADSAGTENETYLAALPESECGEIAREVYAETGIKIHWGESGADFASETFTASPADDEDCLTTLRAAARFLLALPEGMIHEVLAGTAKELHLYLCREIRTVPDLGWSAGGFTDIMDGDLCIVINTDDDYWIDGNIAHEFWHAMEYRIRTLDGAGGTEHISGWETLAGEEGSKLYWDSGLDTIGNEWQQDAAFCADGETEPEKVWFVRAYSRSDPGEDRATVFEALNWAGEQGLFARYPHLREKAEALCAIIRACYPSCAAVELLPWESCLNEP